MSWTSELRSGPVGRWFRTRLPDAAAAHRDVEAAVDSSRVVLPSRARGGGAHAAEVGGAFGQRLSLFVESCPPYYALLGAHRAGLIDWSALDGAASTFTTHAADERGRRARGHLERPAPSGWLDISDHYAGRPVVRHGSHTELVGDFVGRAARLAARHAPPGSLAPTPALEETTLRACAVLAVWEAAYRSGGRLDAQYNPSHEPDADAAALLGRVDDVLVAELRALIEQAHRAGGLDQLRRAAGWPRPGAALGHGGPVFVPDFADGDLLICPPDQSAGNLLVDVKTVRNAHDRTRLRDWLHQLIGYAWLDHFGSAAGAGDWGIARVGLFFGRHGRLVEWPLARLVNAMAGEPVDYARLSSEFVTVLRDSLATRGVELAQQQ